MTGVKHFTIWMNAKLREVSYTALPTKALRELHSPTVRMAAVYVFHAFFAAPNSPRKPIKAHNSVPENLQRWRMCEKAASATRHARVFMFVQARTRMFLMCYSRDGSTMYETGDDV